VSKHNRSSRCFSLSNLIAAGVACGLMAAFIPPSLQQLRRRMEPVICANNLRVCHQGWNVYGSDYDGVWMAPWDRRNPWPGLSSNLWVMEYPYTMVHFVTGGGIPLGETVWMAGDPNGPWWGPDGRHGWPPSYCTSPEDAPQMQCQTSVARGIENNPIWYDVTGYSYAIMGGVEIAGRIRYSSNDYPVPDLMTHPSTTILLHDLGGILTEGRPNAWSIYDGFPTDPHAGRSNYVFCDGHVELLATDQLNERMWQSLWMPDPDPQPDP